MPEQEALERKLEAVGPEVITEFTLTVTEAVWSGHPSLGTVREQIARAANIDAPKEACGFVLDSGGVAHCTNVDDAPWYRFRMDPMEAAAWWATGRVVAVWHSHPTGPAVPSQFDEEAALQTIDFFRAHEDAFGREVEHLIYSVEDEDLGYYAVVNGKLALTRMESPA